MFLAIDATLILQIVNFFVFVAILNAVFLQPVGRALRERRAHIDAVQHDYESHTREVRDLKGKAEELRALARREGVERAQAIRAEAQREAEKILGEAGTQALGIVEEAHATVQREIEAARGNEDALVRDLARSIVERAVGTVA